MPVKALPTILLLYHFMLTFSTREFIVHDFFFVMLIIEWRRTPHISNTCIFNLNNHFDPSYVNDSVSFFSVMATDVLGKTSAPFVIEVVICSGCSGHGVCNFKEYKNATKHTNPVKYAKCICDGGSLPYWAGNPYVDLWTGTKHT